MIEFQNISVDFKQKKGTLAAVHDVSFRIEAGEIFGIAGSSGAGKSTLLRTINLLQGVTSGQVLVDGKNVTKVRGKQLREHRRNIGMIFQHFNLADNLTVYQNIAFVLRAAGKSRQETDEMVRKYLGLVGISEKADVYPSKLSGGQKQRVAIARALIGGAKILLCDEATSALDAETTVSILNLIQTLSKKLGITVVIITHELEVIKGICNRCAVMDGGKLVEIGGVYDLFTKPKNSYTKQLIGYTLGHDLPPEVLKNAEGLLVKLTFRGSKANTPVISDATVRFGVQFNILVGRIEYIEEKPLGVLYVNPVGETDAVRRALDYLKEVVKEVEVIEHGRI
ncbi:MAG TPA: methionine ABC transporter ATP-binding protein [Ruminococcaceae bacterium]|nr:methionine ABC transporter ATP-binding protein [Oscillospiraceae bacterium]